MKGLTYIFLFVIVFVSHCFAQTEILDVKVLPNPSDVSGYIGKQDYKSIKQRITIIDYNILNHNTQDTSSVISYDTSGRMEKYVLFERG